MAHGDTPHTIQKRRRRARRPDVERPRRVSVELPGDALAVRAARRALSSFEDDLTAEARGRLALVVTELVANAVMHSPGEGFWIRLDLAAKRDTVRVEVTAPGSGFEPPRAPTRREREGGFGLVLVDRLADRWGVDGGRATRVWAEIARGTL